MIRKFFHLLLVVFWGFIGLFPAQSAQAAFPGIDGSLTVTAANTILNQYSAVTAISGNTITVSTITNLSSSVVSSTGALGPLAPGDLLMIYQAQGATLDTTNTTSYGNVSSYNSAGRYEFVTVGSISGNTITLATACGNLKNTYAATLAQVIRVPQFSSLTINSGASVTAPSWNGSTGAVVAMHVQGTTTVNGRIDLNGKGFRGGAVVNNSGNNAGSTTYRSNGSYTTGSFGNGGFTEDNVVGGEKGEGIAGSQTTYDTLNGRYGRGAPGNGGGGGTGHNAGGGGGSNGDNGVTWNGLGNPDNSVAGWVTAWGREAAATRPTSSSGGGRGGYTYSANDQDATRNSGSPGNTNWGGDNRRSLGGLGGRPLDYSGGAQARLFFGGGGGSGDGNNSAAGVGGNGGGMAYLIANTVTGSGSIQANGTNGTNTTSGGNDAPGGGGAGGTVVIQATSSVAINANGGNGGDQSITTNEAEGPGGGGGGGYIAASGGTQTVNAGVNGTTNSPSLTEFPPNGATRGATGQTATPPTAANIPLCYTPQIGVAKTVNGLVARNSTSSNFTIPFSITVQNLGDVSLSSSQITENLASAFPPGATFSIASAPTVTAGKALILNPGFNGSSNTNLLASGQTLGLGEQSTIAFSVQVTPDPSKSFGPYNNQVTGSATGATPAGSSNTTDLSDNGINPDPNGNGLPNETGEDDPTPVRFTHMRLVKRITGIKKGSTSTAITTYNDLGTDSNDNATVSWPGGAAPYLKGAFDVAQIPTPTPGLPGPNDEVEYTIYFLSDGGADANNLNLCDFVPAYQQFVSGTIQLNIGGTTTNIVDGSGTGPGSGFYDNTNTSFPAACPIASNKAEGAVYVQVGATPTVTKTPTPTTYYGFLRFRAKVR